ncbi:MAG: nickel-dependent hydrogenase large subunit [Azospirillaceae bacterium]|nr:nickel-dependent hydrogenase large subunit [Azospirillaceae bacterium]
MATATLEGALTIRLRIGDPVAVDPWLHVDVISTRNTRLGRLLAGRPIAEALALVPLLFSLCGCAQGVAATRAVEQATQTPADPAIEAARDILVAGERLESHIWQAAIEWPRRLGLKPSPPDIVAVRTGVAALRQILTASMLNPMRRDPVDPQALQGAIDRLEATIATLFPGLGAAVATPSSWATWARSADPPGAQLIRRIQDRGWSDFGRSDTIPLPELSAAWFGTRLAADEGFGARPLIGDATDPGPRAETGPWARQQAEPLIAALTAQHGNGLLPRFAARLLEIVTLPNTLRGHAARMLAKPGPGSPAAGHDGDTVTGCGAGIADTARGRLAHWVSIADGRITDWRTVAPHEWNFHADGPLVRGLRGARAGTGDDDDLMVAADLLVAALDPCVPCTLERCDRGTPAHPGTGNNHA